MTSGGSKVAGALLIGLIAIAAAIYFRPASKPSSTFSTPSYKGYAPVLGEWFALSGAKNVTVKHVAGPFYVVRYLSHRQSEKMRCGLVDVSTEYKGDANSYSGFWWTGGAFGPAKGNVKSQICDF